MLKSLYLCNFRAFREFTVEFGESAYLVGPNNAGKSTVLLSLKLAESLLRYARTRKADRVVENRGRHQQGYPVNLREFPALRESLRYNFSDEETRLVLSWKNDISLVVVWPSSSAEVDPFFVLERKDGGYLREPAEVKREVPPIGILPILSPLDSSEDVLDDAYVRQNVTGRLSSRHYRNQLRLLMAADEFSAFLSYCSPWLGSLEIQAPSLQMDGEGMRVNVFYTEEGTRIPKELAWAGDGIQVWLQILYHLHRVRELPTVVLDEPEVYLHPDLQRRLVELLSGLGTQVVLATHSAELLADVSPRSLVVVDKVARRGRRVRRDADLQILSDTLGTAYNLRLARALRSRAAVFIEGKELAVLRALARSAGVPELARENDVTVVQLGGYSQWGKVEPFNLLVNQLLPEAIKIGVVLDRDYRGLAEICQVEEDLSAAGIYGHVWRRKEIESYLISEELMARLTGATTGQIAGWLDEITQAMKTEVSAQLTAKFLEREDRRGFDVSTLLIEAQAAFEGDWANRDFRLQRCPPKRIISSLNSRLQDAKLPTLTSLKLARGYRKSEVPTELVETLASLVNLAAS